MYMYTAVVSVAFLDDEIKFYRATHKKRNDLSAVPTVTFPAGFNLYKKELVLHADAWLPGSWLFFNANGWVAFPA